MHSSQKGCEGVNGRARWEKVLYKEQQVDDNYTDATFLKDMVLNVSVQNRHYWKVVQESATVSQQICTVVSVVVVSLALAQGKLSVQSLLIFNVALLLACYLLCAIVGSHHLGGPLVHATRQCLLLVVGVYLMSDLTHTLTRSISSDTIIAASSLLLLAHLYLYDYNFVNLVTDQLTGSLSLAAAVGASVLIASRLNSPLQVFAQVLFSLQAYLLSPYVRRYIRNRSDTAHLGLAVGLVVVSCSLMSLLSRPALVLYSAALLFVTFACPMWLLHIHKFKAKINGPWDEAVPRIPRTLPHQPSS